MYGGHTGGWGERRGHTVGGVGGVRSWGCEEAGEVELGVWNYTLHVNSVR